MNLTKTYEIQKYRNENAETVDDEIISEYSLVININSKDFVRLICSPSDFKELAVGFLFAEGIISGLEDIAELKEEISEGEGKIFVKTKTEDAYNAEADKIIGIRSVTTACGKSHTISYPVFDLVGSESERIVGRLDFKAEDIYNLLEGFNHKSDLFLRTGGVHSCMLATKENVIMFYEDISRHNAVYKILGDCVLSGISMLDKIIIMTGRVPKEMLVHVIRAKIPVVVSRSAPTDRAIELAKNYNLTLIGFARNNRMNIYT